jgi:hypothetical protein
MSDLRIKRFFIFTAISMGVLIFASFLLLFIAIKDKKITCTDTDYIKINVKGKVLSVQKGDNVEVLYQKDQSLFLDFFDPCTNRKLKTIEVSGE